jgi:hypothetical protein
MASNDQHIPFINRIIAFLFTLVFVGALILALFSLPVELVFVNTNRYLDLLDQDEYRAILPEIASDLVFNQLISKSSDNPVLMRIFQETEIKSIIDDTIPADWLQTVFSSSLTQIFDFINFRTPYSAIEIDLGELKNHYLTNSNLVAERIFQTFPNCGGEDLEAFTSTLSELQLDNVPLCKPSSVFQNTITQIIQATFEDSIKGIPENIKISGIFPFDKETQATLFNQYSFLRWGLRLMPLLAIALFISIAILLRRDRSQMLNWCGRTLVFVAIMMLILLTVLLIGFDQLIAMIINRYLTSVIPGFGNLLLKMAQDIGYQTLIWVIISAIVILGFGIMLQISAKWYKPKLEFAENEGLITPSEISEQTTESSDSSANTKSVLPDTLEENVENEEKVKKAKN